MNTKRLTKLVALLLVLVMTLSVLAACGGENKKTEATTTKPVVTDPNGGDDDYVWIDDGKSYTYQTYTAVSPSNWNELTYQDNNDTQIMSYISSSFFSFDFKFDEDGEILPGEFTVNYNAATNLVDVTAKYAETWDLDPESTGYAYAITLRNDLKWENGDPIKAEDFVYTMKEQLNPLFQNYRADSYYNSAQPLVGAKSYAKQGQAGWQQAYGSFDAYSEAIDDQLIFTFAPAGATVNGMAVLEVNSIRAYLESQLPSTVGYTAAQMMNNVFLYNFGGDCPNLTADVAAAMEGKTLAEIKADPVLKAGWDDLCAWWITDPNEELGMVLSEGSYPEFAWENVGIFVGDNEYELVIVLEKALDLLKEDGSLYYKAAYNMSSLPLVHKATYEACKKAPEIDGGLWTSNYCSSAETTMSWGPYKLTEFQPGKYYKVERNTNWYGYNMRENEGLYMTDAVYCETISEWNTAWLKFRAGEIEGIGIDVSIATEYKNSERAYYTPDDFVGSMQLQSSREGLENRESDNVNKTILTYDAFRKAISLAVNRRDYTQQCTTASLPGYGLFNSMHYYDVANGGVFRNSDEAKLVLCEVYGINPDEFASLDDAVAAISGYDLAMARSLVTEAYNQAVADGEIDGDDVVKLTFGTSVDNESQRRIYNFLSNALKEMVVGTPLEGRLETEFKEFGTTWANDFRSGAYDICTGGWTGAAWDPGYFLLAYLSEDYMYSAAWETDKETMTFTMVGVGEDGGDITETMTLLEWYDCLNGNNGCKYDWSSNALDEDQRLQLIAALEKAVLTKYYTVPLSNSFSASLISYKVDYITYEYNTFMGYGGVKYMTYNFTDEEWKAVVAELGGEIDYKQ